MEVVGAEASFDIFAIETVDELLEATFEIAESYAFIDNKPFDLVEDWGVSGIDGVGAVNAARGDNADGGLFVFHNTNLDGGSLSAEKHFVRVMNDK